MYKACLPNKLTANPQKRIYKVKINHTFAWKNENCYVVHSLKQSQSRVTELSHQTIKRHNKHPRARAQTASTMLLCVHTFSETKFQVYGHIAVSLSNKNAHSYFSYITGWKSRFSSTAFKNPLFKYPIHLLVFKLGFKTAEEPEIKLPTSTGLLKKQENSRKNLLLLYWLHQSLWLWGSQWTVENS